ncbi:hypothetical protein [Methylobacterium thuringiense]|uniref:Uncharacterized protein n=1 Tax=Methylobacterium thuringiense TaxID=1003091 RepID=A0ABQ4TL01_9HYPH|nr:hypothetical protein [Methylobacterium thuringiense]GJE55247.1 hypothetical protein EKPJFOCH_1736 [Methylobacterium thuringiense]
MPDSPSASETIAAANALLAEALGTLEALGVDVVIDGNPPRYWVVGMPRTEGEVIALAMKLAPTLSGRTQ